MSYAPHHGLLSQSPRAIGTLFADIGRCLSPCGSRNKTLGAVARVAVARVPGAEWASITEGVDGRFATVATTDKRARGADEIQYELGTGPCVDAILRKTTFRTGDLGEDGRWPEFGRRARDDYGAASMLSYRLFIQDDARIAGLNLYSTGADAFDDEAETIGMVIATHGALAITAATARDDASQLRTALVNSREIGMAMGVLMATHKLDRDQAFDLLRIASQNSNRKLAEIATEVAETGELKYPRNRLSGRSAGHLLLQRDRVVDGGPVERGQRPAR